MTIRVWLGVVLCVAMTGWGEAWVLAASSAGVRQEAALSGREPPAQEKAAQEQPVQEKVVPEKAAAVKSSPGKGAASGAAGEAGQLNVNNASAEQLEALPGIGAAMAARIIEYRQKHGPFKRLEDLMNVRGIGEKNFLKLKPLITVAAGKAERGGGS